LKFSRNCNFSEFCYQKASETSVLKSSFSLLKSWYFTKDIGGDHQGLAGADWVDTQIKASGYGAGRAVFGRYLGYLSGCLNRATLCFGGQQKEHKDRVKMARRMKSIKEKKASSICLEMVAFNI
jgi:hypothetical protein